MKILYHHRTASKDGQAVHIEEMIDAMRANGHQVRVVAPTMGARADQQGAMDGEVGWVHRLKAALPKAVYELLELAYSLVDERLRHSGGLRLVRLARWAEGTAWRSANFVLPVTHVLAGYLKAYGVPSERTKSKLAA